MCVFCVVFVCVHNAFLSVCIHMCICVYVCVCYRLGANVSGEGA